METLAQCYSYSLTVLGGMLCRDCSVKLLYKNAQKEFFKAPFAFAYAEYTKQYGIAVNDKEVIARIALVVLVKAAS